MTKKMVPNTGMIDIEDSTIQLMDANLVSPVSRYNDLKAKSLVLPPLIKV
jgi:hypothetical protein